MATTRTGLDFTGATLISCIRFAYRVKDYQISGPAWLGDLKFDILAKSPANSRPVQFGPMLQTLPIASTCESIAKPKRFRGSLWL